MKKLNWFLGVLLFALIPVLQSCDDDDNNVIGWDWATVQATGGGEYTLVGDKWGTILPVATAIPWYKPVDGERVVAFFRPLEEGAQGQEHDVVVKMEGITSVLTKEVEELTAENEEEFGNDPIVIYEGDMWLGGKYLNLIFRQNIPHSEKHRISLVENKKVTVDPQENDGYVHLELRYNTYDDTTNLWGWGRVSYNLADYYPSAEHFSDTETPTFKGFKVKINSKTNGERTLVLEIGKSVAVPESAKDAHSTMSLK
ncbi:NigD1/NigD2 family lipoprotein [Bacteroides reticulotermitis]|uniref:NigD-like C-terminal beta sandwich domain-containing protein n=2 Tax=Bacteroides reticulotermitis TaxID=1133319 RepID=W4UTP9_9BACE|nr:NigD-like protein [Bacteroides reticulotermitis]MBB4045086.1 hypothetical protein [Bacteroides reticulotermitis]GAE83968.1 hypothetical protein JCM10512_2276 [Bacteroides reticulotermitis JCM 10512]HJD74818.1 NigD-like protein [Bacteroides reticulotermitis]